MLLAYEVVCRFVGDAEILGEKAFQGEEEENKMNCQTLNFAAAQKNLTAEEVKKFSSE